MLYIETLEQEIQSVAIENFDFECRKKSKVQNVLWSNRTFEIPTRGTKSITFESRIRLQLKKLSTETFMKGKELVVTVKKIAFDTN